MSASGRLSAIEALRRGAKNDRLLALSLETLLSMKDGRVGDHAADILSFLAHRGIQDPVGAYLSRVRQLHELQARFERTGRYDASGYADVPAIDRETYNLGLLMSFMMTVHRFEILERLIEFLSMGTASATPRRLLCIGYGTGYELKLVRDLLPEWELSAFDSSPEASTYARDLLSWFGRSTAGLELAEFPLEWDRGLAEHEGCYGKVVACELLEHLEDPAHALRNLRRITAPTGTLFLTMAVNIAQEDHVFLYRDAAQARRQVLDSGLILVREWLAPMTVLPFAERDRERIFRKGNYVCIAAPSL